MIAIKFSCPSRLKTVPNQLLYAVVHKAWPNCRNFYTCFDVSAIPIRMYGPGHSELPCSITAT